MRSFEASDLRMDPEGVGLLQGSEAGGQTLKSPQSVAGVLCVPVGCPSIAPRRLGAKRCAIRDREVTQILQTKLASSSIE